MKRIVFVLLLAGCGDDTTMMPMMDGALCSADPVLDELPAAPIYAVVSSDFTSTSVAMLDGSGAVLQEGWLDSSSAGAGLVAALSGDVVLPTEQPSGSFVAIDRLGSDVVSRFCHNGALVGQVRVGAEGFASNPQDFLVMSETLAWVSRYEANADTTAAEADRGSDLFGVDPTTMEPNGERIDLSSFGGTAMGMDENMNPVDVPILARPGRIVRRGGHLVVSLERLPVNLFGTERGAGEGMVAIVDASNNSVTTHTLAGMSNCGQVVAVPETPDEVIVACRGYSTVSFSDEAGVRATAGLVRLRVGSSVEEISSWRASADTASMLAVWNVVAIGGDRVAAVEQRSTGNDRLVLTDLSEGTQQMVLEAAMPFVLGQGAYDGVTLWIPDAAAMRLRSFAGARLAEGDSVSVGPAALPPREIRRL